MPGAGELGGPTSGVPSGLSCRMQTLRAAEKVSGVHVCEDPGLARAPRVGSCYLRVPGALPPAAPPWCHHRPWALPHHLHPGWLCIGACPAARQAGMPIATCSLSLKGPGLRFLPRELPGCACTLDPRPRGAHGRPASVSLKSPLHRLPMPCPHHALPGHRAGLPPLPLPFLTHVLSALCSRDPRRPQSVILSARLQGWALLGMLGVTCQPTSRLSRPSRQPRSRDCPGWKSVSSPRQRAETAGDSLPKCQAVTGFSRRSARYICSPSSPLGASSGSLELRVGLPASFPPTRWPIRSGVVPGPLTRVSRGAAAAGGMRPRRAPVRLCPRQGPPSWLPGVSPALSQLVG